MEQLEKLYKSHYERLFTLAFRMTGNQANAEDVMQNAFLSAIKSYDSFQHKSSLYTWLYVIVLNAAKSFIQKEKKLPMDIYAEENNISLESAYNYIGTFGELPEDHTMVEQVRETCLQMFMNCLPPDYRVVFTLREILQLSVKESAEILDISENSVKIRLSRAKEMLREHFNGRCSLVKPGALCNCRSFASHVTKTGKESAMLDFGVIRRVELEAREQFTRSLKDILAVEDLYATTFRSIPFEHLKERVVARIENGNNHLLS